MTSLPQPFLDHPDVVDIPKEMVNDVEEVYEWICAEPGFPNYSKNHAYLFLHACLGDVAAAKKALERYTQIRTGAPHLFDNRDIMLDDIQFVYDVAQMVALPKKSPEGYNILVYRLADTDPSKVHFGNAVKAFCMFNDVRISEDLITEGYVVVFDMKGLRFGHLTRVQFGPLRTFMAYIQEAHPVRLKRIYVVHTSFFINQIMNLIKPLIKHDLLSLLTFITSGPDEVLPTELLPVDYGGPLDSLENMHKEQREMIQSKYRDWLIDTNNLKEQKIDDDESSFNHISNEVSLVRTLKALD